MLFSVKSVGHLHIFFDCPSILPHPGREKALILASSLCFVNYLRTCVVCPSLHVWNGTDTLILVRLWKGLREAPHSAGPRGEANESWAPALLPEKLWLIPNRLFIQWLFIEHVLCTLEGAVIKKKFPSLQGWHCSKKKEARAWEANR